MRRILTSIALAAAMTAPAFAYDYKDYVDTRGDVEVQAYLQGIGEGLGWAIAFTDAPHPKLFCAPDDKAHNRAEYVQILDTFAAANPELQQYPVEMILLLALQAQYPC
jgi:hypothetical protein